MKTTTNRIKKHTKREPPPFLHRDESRHSFDRRMKNDGRKWKNSRGDQMPKKLSLEKSKKNRNKRNIPISLPAPKIDRWESGLSSSAKGEPSEKTHFGVEHAFEIGQRRSREHLSVKRPPARLKELKQVSRRRAIAKENRSRQAKQRGHERFFTA